MKTIPLAGCVITDDSSRVLLIHRNTPQLTQWELPGGKLEDGETLMEAAEREVREEVGLTVNDLYELGSADFVHDNVLWDYHWFGVREVTGEPVIGETDRYDGVQYVDILHENLSKLGVSINVWNLQNAIKKGEVEL